MIKPIIQSVMNKEGAVATGAAASPIWLNDAQGALMTFSDYAAAMLPILGVGWLLMQMGYATWDQFKSDDEE